ncbi:MAG TPA: hypothetical protein VFF19_09330, partial [Reyranella sp.]|nr:hypothetical protein [Reyranella sp.]
ASPGAGSITGARAGAAPPQPVAGHRLRLTGMIETGDAQKLGSLLSKLPVSTAAKADSPLTTIELSSLGGSLTEAFEIGALLRTFKVIAVVRKADICLSACALVFLAGNAHRVPSTYPAECNLEIGGKVGFHNFSLNRNGLRDVTGDDPVASRLQGFADARGGAAQLVKYASEIGLPPDFVAGLIGRAVDDFQFIETVGQFLALKVCPIGLGRPGIALDAQAINICSNSTVAPASATPLVATAIPMLQARRYMLERVQENMQLSKAKGRLADQLASGAVMRVTEEIDRLYDDLRAAGLALPDILGQTFEVGRRVGGAYEILCYVSLSPDKPDEYDVVLQGPKGLSDSGRPPPENSRRLFLFNPRDNINPRAPQTR